MSADPNNTILTGSRRADGYAASIRMTARFGSLPRAERPLLGTTSSAS